MKVLLDECLPRKLKNEFAGHEVVTVPEMGWAGMKNGALLRFAEANFDVFVTADQNVQYQQNVSSRVIGVVILVASNNRFETLLPLCPTASSVIATIRPGEVVRVGS